MNQSAIVVGAGIVGVSAAIHLQRRGWQVTLIDRKPPGEETSFGNSGLIQCDGVAPHAFPQQLGMLLRYALNNRTDAHFHIRALPGYLPFLARYWWHSNPRRHMAIAHAYAPLMAHAIPEHEDLIEASCAQALVRKDGWVKAFRTRAPLEADAAEAEGLRKAFGVRFETLSSADLARLEPDLHQPFAGAIRWQEAWSILDPHALTTAYVAYFERLGGRFLQADATGLEGGRSGWQVTTGAGTLKADAVVLAAGPWADGMTRRLGYAFPFGAKRGYHMHYVPAGGARLNHWLLDGDAGYFLAPMRQGIRLTTGVEFARIDAPPTPVQLDRAERVARTIFPLGDRLDDRPWVGARPCTPDMMPIIGKAPRHDGLWFALGHAHHGLTLGPVTGRVLAEAMTGAPPLIDISAFSPRRFVS